MDNPEKLATMGSQDEDKQNTICTGHHYAQTNINKVNKTRHLLQTTGGNMCSQTSNPFHCFKVLNSILTNHGIWTSYNDNSFLLYGQKSSVLGLMVLVFYNSFLLYRQKSSVLGLMVLVFYNSFLLYRQKSSVLDLMVLVFYNSFLLYRQKSSVLGLMVLVFYM